MTDEMPQSIMPNNTDRATAIAAALTGMVPVAGSIISELIFSLVPNQRADRIAHYIASLESRIEFLETATRPTLENMTPEKTALFEDGAYSSVRALSNERIEQIARIVVSGMMGNDRDAEYQRRYLRLLQELFDTDLAALHSIAAWIGVPTTTRQMTGADIKAASDEELQVHFDRKSIEEDQLKRLKRLGLVDQELQIYPDDWMKREVAPQLRLTSARLTGLGWTLLERIGQAHRVREEYSMRWRLTPHP